MVKVPRTGKPRERKQSEGPVIKRTFRGLVQILGGLGAGLAIVMGLIAWQLSSGPISLGFLNDQIEEALSRIHPSYRMRLEDTILTWAGWDRTLDIRVTNLQAISDDDRVVATIPELSLSFSARALFRGLAAPRSIEGVLNPIAIEPSAATAISPPVPGSSTSPST